jgi:hypothetical protein
MPRDCSPASPPRSCAARWPSVGPWRQRQEPERPRRWAERRQRAHGQQEQRGPRERRRRRERKARPKEVPLSGRAQSSEGERSVGRRPLGGRRQRLVRPAPPSMTTAMGLPRRLVADRDEAHDRMTPLARQPVRALVRQASELPSARSHRRHSWTPRRPQSRHPSLRGSLQSAPHRPPATAGRPQPAEGRFGDGDPMSMRRRPEPQASMQLSSRPPPQRARRCQATQRGPRRAPRPLKARRHRRVGAAIRGARSAGGRPRVTASARRVR